MSGIYADEHRVLQDRFGSRPLADRLDDILVHDALTPEEQAFIGTRDMFFLSTVDADGFPTVSYKGGAPGFIRVEDARTLVFPCYDGNGMFYSAGNLGARPQIGLLFIDFETPHRLRCHGRAEIDVSAEAVAAFPGALMVVRVRTERVFVNCSRYVHRFERVRRSRYVPDEAGEAPFASWKRIDVVQDVLPGGDAGRAGREGGVLTADDYAALLARGEA